MKPPALAIGLHGVLMGGRKPEAATVSPVTPQPGWALLTRPGSSDQVERQGRSPAHAQPSGVSKETHGPRAVLRVSPTVRTAAATVQSSQRGSACEDLHVPQGLASHPLLISTSW